MEKKANPGYHINEIPRGVYGEFSKVAEEFAEVQDAWEQRCLIMAIVELTDLLGALEAYYGEEQFALYCEQAAEVMFATSTYALDLEAHIDASFKRLNASYHNPANVIDFIAILDLYLDGFNMTIEDAMAMNHITKRAFIAGRRVPNT
jgi:hypothetical protein